MFTRDTHKHKHTHTHTPELDINTGKTGVTGSTMLQSGCDREDIETCSITDITTLPSNLNGIIKKNSKQMALTQ